MGKIHIKILVYSSVTGGWSENAMSNNPLFDLSDTVITGLSDYDTCLTFRNINTIEGGYSQEGTLVTIIYNNIANKGEARDGRLKIGFLIPKGYRLPDGLSPVDIAEEIKEYIADNYLVKDEAGKLVKNSTGCWNFNTKSIDTHAMDEVCKRHELVPCPSTFVPMNPSGKMGLIECGDTERLAQLLSDTQYEQFKDYREIIAVESAPNATYERITNIEIPRPHKYTVKGIGENELEASQSEYMTGTAIVKIKAPKSQNPYYQYNDSEYNWADIKDNKNVLVIVDHIEETITAKLKRKPKELTYQLSVYSNDKYGKEYIKKHINDIILFSEKSNGNIISFQLDTNGQFKLIGDENTFFEKKQLRLSMPDDAEYKIKAPSLYYDSDTRKVSAAITGAEPTKSNDVTDYSMIGLNDGGRGEKEDNKSSIAGQINACVPEKEEMVAMHIRVEDRELIDEEQSVTFLLFDSEGVTGKKKRVLKIVQPYAAGSDIMEPQEAEPRIEGHVAKNNTSAAKPNATSLSSKKDKQQSKQQRRDKGLQRRLEKEQQRPLKQQGNERDFGASEAVEEDSKPKVGREWVVGIPKTLCKGTKYHEVIVSTTEWEWRSQLWPDIQSHGSIDIKEEDILPKNQRVEMAKRYWREGVIAVLVVVIFLILTSGAFIASVTSLFRSHENSESMPAANVEIVEDKAAQSELGPYDPGVQEIRADQTETEVNGKSGLDGETEKAKSNNTINDDGQNGYGTGTADFYHGTGITDKKQ